MLCDKKSSEKYVDGWYNGVITRQKNHEGAVKTRVSIVNLQLKFGIIQKDYLTQTLAFLARNELKKNKFQQEKIELTRLF